MKLYVAVERNELTINEFDDFNKNQTPIGGVTDLEIIDHFNSDFCNDTILKTNCGIVISNDTTKLLTYLNDNSDNPTNYSLQPMVVSNYNLTTIPATGNNWSEEEVDALKALYPFYDNKQIARILIDRSINSIRTKAKNLLLKKTSELSENDEMPNIKDTRKYIQFGISGDGGYNLASIRDMVSLRSTYPDVTMEQRYSREYNSGRLEILDIVLKNYDPESIVQYAESCEISLPHILLYASAYGNFNLFEYIEKNHPTDVADFYALVLGTLYIKDGEPVPTEYLPKHNRWIAAFDFITNNSPSIDEAIKRIKYILSKTDRAFNDYLVSENIAQCCKQSELRWLLTLVNNDEFKKYINGIIDGFYVDDVGTVNALLIDELEKRNTDGSFDSLYADLLNTYMDDGNVAMVSGLMKIFTDRSFVIDNKILLFNLSASPYFSKEFKKYNCEINISNLSTFDQCTLLLDSAKCNNFIFANMILPSITEYYNICEDRSKLDTIEASIDMSRNHFKLYGNYDMAKKLEWE